MAVAMILYFSLLSLALCRFAVSEKASGCTTVLISGGATVDGQAFTSHTADSDNGDFRVAYVPAKDHAPGAKRKIYRGDGNYMMYPRVVDLDRSPQYVSVDDPVHPNEVIGTIPEVPHTYALWEALYGVMNEHGLAMGESTCEGNAVGVGVTAGGNALFTIGNLMSVALERCKTAVCAVETMGELAETYGFYGEDPGVDGAGEAVNIADAYGDAWAFQITGGVPNRTGALWVAQKVPHGHVAVVSNSFTIQDIDLDDRDNFRGTKNLLQHATAGGYWNGHGTFNWQRALAPDVNVSFEAGLNMYDTLRMWRIFSLAAPSLSLEATNHLTDYPFSVPVDKKVGLEDLQMWLRDMYDGTEFDMTLGALAGPWQSPRRFDGAAGSPAGQYARSVSVSWSIYSIIGQPGAKHPVLWYAADSGATSVFVPFYTGALKEGGDGRFASKLYGAGSMLDFSLTNVEEQPAWWAFSLVADWMQISYANMTQQYVFPKVQEMQRYVLDNAKLAEAEADRASSSKDANRILADRATSIQQHVVKEWWNMASMLIVRYKDQKYNFPPNAPTDSVGISVPAYWMEMVGYNPHAMYPCWAQPSGQPPVSLPAEDKEVARRAAAKVAALDAAVNFAHEMQVSSSKVDLFQAVVFGMMCTAVGSWLGHGLGFKRGFSEGQVADSSYMRA